MAEIDLLAMIKAKQTQIAKLQAELEEARALLAAIVNHEHSESRRRFSRRRSSKSLEHSPTAHEAAKVLRAARQPLHVSAILKAMKKNGHIVGPATLVSTLSRWVSSRAVFYRERPNVFGLIELRKGTLAKARQRRGRRETVS